MIRYHGGPATPLTVAQAIWTARHGMCSFARPEQIALLAEVSQSFVLDCGAYSFWRAGEGRVDVGAYRAFVEEWHRHPGFDWAIIPDVIDGSAGDNDALIDDWYDRGGWASNSVPVYHLHEDLDRLSALAEEFPHIALGSSGDYTTPGTQQWWDRMAEVMARVCDELGRPTCKLHGLRMLSPTVFSHLPLASADSCNVARNAGDPTRWKGAYAPLTNGMRALVLAERIEQHASAARWTRRCGIQQSLELVG